MPIRVLDNPNSAVPEVQLLSNGNYHVMVTHAGGGYSRWTIFSGDALARRRHARPLGHVLLPARHGKRLDLVDRASTYIAARRALRRATPRKGARNFAVATAISIPIPKSPYRRNTKRSHPRRVRITNHSTERRRTIEVTSYTEVVLAAPAADALHPAFSNLFVQTEIVDARHAILCTRRPRSSEESVPWMLHLMAVHDAEAGQLSYETDRARFIGRGRTLAAPRAMDDAKPLSGRPRLGARPGGGNTLVDDPRPGTIRQRGPGLWHRRQP